MASHKPPRGWVQQNLPMGPSKPGAQPQPTPLVIVGPKPTPTGDASNVSGGDTVVGLTSFPPTSFKGPKP